MTAVRPERLPELCRERPGDSVTRQWLCLSLPRTRGRLDRMCGWIRGWVSFRPLRRRVCRKRAVAIPRALEEPWAPRALLQTLCIPRTTSIRARRLGLTALPLTRAESWSAPARAPLRAEVVATKLGGRRAGQCRERRAAGRGGAERRRRRREQSCSAVRGDARSRRAELDGPFAAPPLPSLPPSCSFSSGRVAPLCCQQLRVARGAWGAPAAPRMLLLGVVGAAVGRVAGSGGDSLGFRGLLFLVLLSSLFPVWPWLTLKTL